MKSDAPIEEFFKEAKSEDERINIPSFEGLTSGKKKNRKLIIPIGIAASILFLSVFYFNNNSNRNTNLNKGLVAEKDSLKYVDRADLYNWESPTASLINDF